MKPHTLSGFDTAGPVAYITTSRRHSLAAGNFLAGELLFRRSSAAKQRKQRTVRSVVCRRSHPENEELFAGDNNNGSKGHTRRQALLASSLALGAWFLQSATASGYDEPPPPQQQKVIESVASNEEKEKEKEIETEKEEVITSRIYDATVIGEPMAIGKDKRKVWEKVMNARIVYLGEAEQVPIRDDKDLELEIVKNLRKRCAEIDRPMSLALEAFPSDLQGQLTQYMENRF